MKDQAVSRSTSKAQTALQAPLPTVKAITYTPSNNLTIVTSAFCSVLEVKDIRYDLSVYGPFLKDIPRRLGSSAALDASVNALTTGLSFVHSRRRSPEVYESYVQALKALRICLNDPEEVGSANTLCAVYLVMVCQVSSLSNTCRNSEVDLIRDGLDSTTTALLMAKR